MDGWVIIVTLEELVTGTATHYEVLDVRTPAEWEGGVIGSPIKINYYDEDFDNDIDNDLPWNAGLELDMLWMPIYRT